MANTASIVLLNTPATATSNASPLVLGGDQPDLITSGFRSTAFGTPTIAIVATAVAPATHVGAPRAVVTTHAAGFTSTALGAPAAVITAYAAGFTSTALGAARTALTQPASSVAPTTAVGTPQAVYDQLGEATGFSSTAFGAPAGANDLYPAFGFSSTQLGEPVATWQQFGLPAGFSTTSYGTATAALALGASGFTSTAVGTPSGIAIQRAAGFTSTQLGAPVSYVTLHASGFASSHFGTPRLVVNAYANGFSTTQYGTHVGYQFWIEDTRLPSTKFGTPVLGGYPWTLTATGWRSTKVGRPTSFKQIIFEVPYCLSSGWRSAQLGTPTALVPRLGRVRGAKPSTSFGIPGSVSWPEDTWVPSCWFTARPLHRPARFGKPLGVDNYQYPVRGFTRAGHVGRPRLIQERVC